MMNWSSSYDQQGSDEPKSTDRERDEFLAMVSHELRTPTNAILGWAELLSQGCIGDESFAVGIETIKRNARLQVWLIEQLLDFSRINNGRLSLEAQKVTLAPAVEMALNTMVPLARAKAIELNADLDPAAGTIIGDPARLHQVVTNLLSNAIKFTPQEGRVEVRLVRRESFAEVLVSDTGRGIRPEFLPYIFDPFSRGSATKAAGHDGLGLGLAIARYIVERHGGSIHADSLGEGEGATFTIRLPLEEEITPTGPQSRIA